jgi:iron-sulfur cluster repair protein YtfE (RIC family)
MPDVRNLRAELAELSAELFPHLHDEERNVFRIVEALESAWLTNEKPPSLDHGLHKMISELTVAHGSIAQRIHRIRDLRLRIGTRLDIAPQCQAVLTLLEQFEGHLRQQIFIENCIYFPRALALEEQLTATANASA